VNNCCSVPTAGVFGKYSYFHALSTCRLVIVFAFPRLMFVTPQLTEWYCPYASLVSLSSVNEGWDSNKCGLGKQTNIGNPFGMCYVYRQTVGRGKWPMFVQVHRSHLLASIHKLHTCRICQFWESHLCVMVVQYAAILVEYVSCGKATYVLW